MIGKTLDDYRIPNEHGKGGMGEVYQAKDQVPGRKVAITPDWKAKVLGFQLDDFCR
jgi:hypothetical protein